MEYCQTNGYITPQDWLNNFKHYSDSKEQISYTEEEVEELIVGYDLYLDCCNEKENHPVGPRDWFDCNKKK